MQANNELPWTGERYIPGHGGPEIRYEHEHRYTIATDLAVGKECLDIGCGEGYGTAALARVARRVAGVDVDRQAVEYATAKYRDLSPAATFLAVEPGAPYPFPDHSFDVITCFEVIEHLPEHHALLNEITRLLKPTGILLISTPEKSIYSDQRNYVNEFHLSEMYLSEFKSLLDSYFAYVKIVLQRVISGSIMLPLGEDQRRRTQLKTHLSTPGILSPMYLVAACSQSEFSCDLSGIFLDPSDELLDDYRASIPGSRVRQLLDDMDEERAKAQRQLTEYENELHARANALRAADEELSRLRSLLQNNGS